jgi:hypothetical protein
MPGKPDGHDEREPDYWFARHARSIIVLIITLAMVLSLNITPTVHLFVTRREERNSTA